MSSKIYYGIFFGLVISFFGCNNHISKSDILTNHLKGILKNEYNENADYIVINRNGCHGCISKNIVFLYNNPQYLKAYRALIVSESVVKEFPYINKLKIKKYIDSNDRLDILNTGVTGFSTVSIKNNIVVKILNSNVFISSDNLKLKEYFNIHKASNTFVELNSVQFENNFPNMELDKNNVNKTTLLFFTSDHCSPCKKMFPIIDSLSVVYKDSVDFFFIKSDKSDNIRIFNKYDIYATPTIIILKRNIPMIEKIGLIDKEEIVNYIL